MEEGNEDNNTRNAIIRVEGNKEGNRKRTRKGEKKKGRMEEDGTNHGSCRETR